MKSFRYFSICSIISYYNNNGNTDELVAFADEMLSKNPLPIFHFVKGFVFQNNKNFDAAIEEYKKCIEQDPNYTGAYRNLGICYCTIAQEKSDAMTNLNIKSKEYKEKKDEIRSKFDVIAAEMEGGAIGQVCYINNIPFAILRTISDGEGGGMDYAQFVVKAAEVSIAVVQKFIARVGEL